MVKKTVRGSTSLLSKKVFSYESGIIDSGTVYRVAWECIYTGRVTLIGEQFSHDIQNACTETLFQMDGIPYA